MAARAATTDDASAATSMPSTTPTTKKGKTTDKNEKSSKPIDLRMSPMWVSTTDLSMHRVVAIAHEQKWVAALLRPVCDRYVAQPLR